MPRLNSLHCKTSDRSFHVSARSRTTRSLQSCLTEAMSLSIRDFRMMVVCLAIAVALSACLRNGQTPPQSSVELPSSPAREPELAEAFEALDLETGEHAEGLVVQLPSVFLFEFESDVLSPEAVERLLAVADVLNRPTALHRTIRIEGHTDSFGTPDYNLALSERRARAVTNQLSAGQVDTGRMSTRGFGSTAPRAPNVANDGADNPEGRALNRRVEIIIEDPYDPVLAEVADGSRE